jgi:hypothetical protein
MPDSEAGRGGKPVSAGTSSGGKGTGGSGGLGGVMGIAGDLPVAGGGVGGSVIVEPLPVPEEGLELWLRADQGVVQVGGLIATWKDSSSHGRNASQSEVTSRPKYANDAMTERSAIAFDGIDDFLKLPAIDADFTGGVSIFGLALQNAASECEGLFEASNGPEIDDLHLGGWKGAPIYEVGVPFLHAADSPAVLGMPQLLSALHYPDANVHLRRNSATLLEAQFELPPLVTRHEVFIGHSLYQGCTPWSGAIAEVLVYSRAVNDEELVEIETYLQKKWVCCEE